MHINPCYLLRLRSPPVSSWTGLAYSSASLSRSPPSIDLLLDYGPTPINTSSPAAICTVNYRWNLYIHSLNNCTASRYTTLVTPICLGIGIIVMVTLETVSRRIPNHNAQLASAITPTAAQLELVEVAKAEPGVCHP